MTAGSWRWASLVLALPLALFLGRPAGAQCPAPPPNDNFANAIAITALPFSASVDTTRATTELGEPQACSGARQTVWYKITPSANVILRADTAGSSFFDTSLVAYRASGPGFGGLSLVTCASFGDAITFRAQAATTYYLQAGSVFSGGGNLHVNVQEVLPPPNDDFANATPITAVPFDDTVDTTGASTEPGEPASSCGFPNGGSVWYVFTPTPAQAGSLTATVNRGFEPLVAVYTGTSLSTLREVKCRSSFPSAVLTFRAASNTTYYFQAGNVFDGSERGPLQFQLEVAPAPVARFSFFPSDPSVFDTVQFCDNSFDPGGEAIQSQAWAFGDGVTVTTKNFCVNHQYANDGDYTATLTITTDDGRTASTSQVVHVRTHDVAITSFSVPQAAHAGETRSVVVGVRGGRYPENVQVQLFRSVPGGFQLVGTLTQSVPVRSGNRATDFDFSYTFTSDDAQVGKVTFKATATITDARDAFPADNEAIASPTKVQR